MAVELPQWLQDLRHAEVVAPVQDDPRSGPASFFGLSRDDAMDAIGWGQAPFDKPYRGLSPPDRALLYAYFNQKGHLEELTEAFRQMFANKAPDEPIVIDLGCGPCTGGLALSGVLEKPSFDYIGVDVSKAMHDLGEHLATHAPQLKEVRRTWATDIESVEWPRAPGWRAVLVIVSYLLASPTLDAVKLVAQLKALLTKLGKGHVVVLYTNSPTPAANRDFPVFRRGIQNAGFDMPADGTGEIIIERWSGERLRRVRYAVFHRPEKKRLRLGDN